MQRKLIFITALVVGLTHGQIAPKVSTHNDTMSFIPTTILEAAPVAPVPVSVVPEPAPIVPESTPVAAEQAPIVPEPAPTIFVPEPPKAIVQAPPAQPTGFKGWLLTPDAWQVNLNPEWINIGTDPGTSVWAVEFSALRKLQDKVWAGTRITIPAGSFVGGGGFEILGSFEAWSMGEMFSVQPNVGLGYIKATRFRKGSRSGQNYRWTQEQFLSTGVNLNSYWFSLNCRLGLANGAVDYIRASDPSGLEVTYSVGLGLNYRF